MGAFKQPALLLALLAGSLAGISRAQVPCRLCDEPATRLGQSAPSDRIELEIETNLNFGRLILAGDGGGAALVRPDGSNGAEGSLASLSPRTMVGSARVHGLPGRAIRVELPQRIELYSLGGGRISLDQVISDLPSLPRLDGSGNLTFRFGGRVKVTGEAEGDYRGNLPITVEYQ